MKKLLTLIFVLLLAGSGSLWAQRKDAKKDAKASESQARPSVPSSFFNAISFRSVGPAWASGRIADLAVNPSNHSEIYAAVASGNIWKSENNGTTWKPIFDKYGAYAIGCIVIDPGNHNVVWAGTGENNHQRALGWGDGVYRSDDAGASWKNMGLKESRQIGGIAIDPRNSDVVYVAAEGSAWGPGGDRGLYKSTDGGKTWEKILNISENTGVNNVVLDPRNPDVIYCTSEQRRRHVGLKIGGGPESAVYKSTDAGKSFEKIMKGLPGGDIGGMGIAVSPVNPDVLYLIMEAQGDAGGFFRSVNRGASWEKMSSYHSTGQYYNKIICDPKDVNRIFSLDTYTQVTVDGGRTWKNLGNKERHVDDHAMWIDPTNTDHFYIGGDGGIYETYDNGSNFIFKSNLPVTQFYRVAVDNSYPFYYIYGGTQDNNSMGGPSANTRNGVVNDDWFVTSGGDGFWLAIDPEEPDIVYTESQYGNASRYDRRSGERISIKPFPGEGELTYRWNWDTPILISPHNNKRIYMAANFLFRSEDRGSSWKTISPDLTRNENRDNFKVMDRYWPSDAVAKNRSTSLWGTIVSLSESRLQEDLLYTGSDDGVIAVSEDGGASWRMNKTYPGVPEYTWVSDVLADKHNVNVVYATFNNHKRDDFRPYVLKSTDKGRTWTSISSNLPANGPVHTIEQDHVNPNLLFLGTEFSFFVSFDAGATWTEFNRGLPTIAVRDIAIQERENDLVIATFGRGFYIIDDYTPLQNYSNSITTKAGYIFPVKDAKMFVQTSGFDNQGSMYYVAENPPYGATITYYVNDVPKTARDIRKENEKKLAEKGDFIPQPTARELSLEEREIKPYLIFTITDEEGSVIRKLYKNASKGVGRVTWNFTYAGYQPVRSSGKFNPVAEEGRGRWGGGGISVMPGKYFVSMAIYANGEIKELAGPEPFVCKPLDIVTLPVTNAAAKEKWMKEMAAFAKTAYGAISYVTELDATVNTIMQTIHQMPDAPASLMKEAAALSDEMNELTYLIRGISVGASTEETPPSPVSLSARLSTMSRSLYSNSGDISGIADQQFTILKKEFPALLERIQKAGRAVDALNAKLDEIKAPWTTGRVPKF
ncbi:MAG: glycosyl hydrolase [Bacteroidales bacterium]|nr:glycosyl hydrolase [Bacteroidales bacterium]MBK7733663.1 glycosyl hydrolase [Bacteroidales bacterium]HHU99202.1 glycosyl hydrolase [Bacteroidales bacterium]